MHVNEVLSDEMVSRQVTVRGWIYRARESGSLVFIVVRDSTGIIQVVVEKSSVKQEEFEMARRATIESSLEVTGLLVKEKKAPTGYEIHEPPLNSTR